MEVHVNFTIVMHVYKVVAVYNHGTWDTPSYNHNIRMSVMSRLQLVYT